MRIQKMSMLRGNEEIVVFIVILVFMITLFN